MFDAKHYSKSATAMMVALTLNTVAVTSILNPTPAAAQLFPSPSRSETFPRERERRTRYEPLVIPRGAIIPVEYEQEKILVTREETAPITLAVAANIRNRARQTLIPYGSEIVGQIEPAGNGSRFVAEEIVFPDGSAQFISANSAVITRTETVKRGASTGDILKGAAIGGVAATVLAGIFGDINAVEVLGGAGAGALAGILLGDREVELVSIDPNNDLDLTLQSDLALR
ncbi:hypothetical protein [Myxosarcina sp. GI1(2024)]